MAEGTNDGALGSEPPDNAAIAVAETDRGRIADVAVGALRWKRGALAVVSLVAVTFIGLSVLQLVPAVFGADIRPLPASAPGTPGRVCADGVAHLVQALDRAGPMAGGPAFVEALKPEWDAAPGIQQACGASAEGTDAWAALLRLRSAQEQLAGRNAAGLLPLRREVAAHLPADSR
jgi:hypothetical protein